MKRTERMVARLEAYREMTAGQKGVCEEDRVAFGGWKGWSRNQRRIVKARLVRKGSVMETGKYDEDACREMTAGMKGSLGKPGGMKRTERMGAQS
jgi:hypothetical protein